MRLPARIAALLFVLGVLWACTDRAPAPTGLGIAASRNGVPFDVGLASPAWQEMALSHAPQPPAMNPLQATHAYALVGVAQYLAVQRADMAVGSNGRSNVDAERGAVAGASAAVLTYLFPGAAQAFEDLVTEQANAGAGQRQPWFTRGEAMP